MRHELRQTFDKTPVPVRRNPFEADAALGDAVGREDVRVVPEVGRLDQQVAQRTDAVLERLDGDAVDHDVDDLERTSLGEERCLDAREIFGHSDGRHRENLQPGNDDVQKVGIRWLRVGGLDAKSGDKAALLAARNGVHLTPVLGLGEGAGI